MRGMKLFLSEKRRLSGKPASAAVMIGVLPMEARNPGAVKASDAAFGTITRPPG